MVPPLEKLASLKNIAFDKTGTITSGILKVENIAHTDAISTIDFLQIVASLEQNSTHILARKYRPRSQKSTNRFFTN